MDLIYMNSSKEDIGVLKDYTFDLAFGSDENDFECEINKDNHCCTEGFYLYIEGTEYGGIIDKIYVNTEEGSIKYKGRTWHGILAKKILEPDNGEDYLILSGEANDVIAVIIERIGLDGLFSVSTADSGIEIAAYQVNRYADAYSVIKDMLFKATGKLHIEYKKDKVELSCIPYIDYSQNEEWDSSQLEFGIEKNFRPLNHLVCLGQGDLKNRHVIHLFADKNGGIQPYTLKENPLQNSDYILDKSKQVLFGSDEVCEVYDYSSAEITENYNPLTIQPEGWSKVYPNYYIRASDSSFSQLTREYEDAYVVQTGSPSDWAKHYGNYYTKDGNSYETVEAVSSDVYTVQAAKPSDWEKDYDSFFYLYSDGTTSQYKSVAGVSTDDYVIQTQKPTNWDDSFSSYYKKKKKESGFEKVEGTEKNDYTKLTEQPSDWSNNYGNYYYKYSDGVKTYYSKVPSETKYVYKVQTSKPSDWKENANNYYAKKNGKYIKLECTAVVSYALQKEQPSDWKTNYKSYYYKYSTGTEIVYKNVQSVTKYKYVLQTIKPSDWSTNYKSYYYIKDGKYEHVSGTSAPTWVANTYYTKESTESAPTWVAKKYYTKNVKSNAPTWVANTYYTRSSKSVAPTWVAKKYYSCTTTTIAPTWKAKKYYTKNTITIAPKWESNKYYTKTIRLSAPTWVSNTYYTKTTVEVIPAWGSGKYFELLHDYYATLVAGGIEKLKESLNCDSLEINLDPDEEYDIGDVVGASEYVTGLSTWQQITKKIVTIKDNETTITYKVGE